MKAANQCSTKAGFNFQTYFTCFIKMVPASIEGSTQVLTELTFESSYIFWEIKPRDAGERVHDGSISHLPFHKGGNGEDGAFLWIIPEIIEKLRAVS